ncbi:hypothetical protein GCM10027610_031260 [Dactylosporangium cerinum]
MHTVCAARIATLASHMGVSAPAGPSLSKAGNLMMPTTGSTTAQPARRPDPIAVRAGRKISYPLLSWQGPGGYRVRLHARGRDAAYDLTPATPSEHHLSGPAPACGPDRLSPGRPWTPG